MEIGTKVDEEDYVEVEGQRVDKSREEKHLFSLNKPLIVCTTDRR